jgi:hypothetical protein
MTQRERQLFVYDGRERLGRIDVAADGKARAFDRRGKALGRFPNFQAASAAFKSPVRRRARAAGVRTGHHRTVEPRTAAVQPLK